MFHVEQILKGGDGILDFFKGWATGILIVLMTIVFLGAVGAVLYGLYLLLGIYGVVIGLILLLGLLVGEDYY